VRDLIEDLRSAVRMLTRHPHSTALIAGLLALGIGACTSVFSLFDAVFLRSLPVHRPDELVTLVQYFRPLGYRSEFPRAYYRSLRDESKSLTVFGQTDWPTEFVMSEPAPAEEITLRAVTANYFQALGVSTLYGRPLLASDARSQSGVPPVVLSYDFWERRLNGNRQVVHGQSILINNRYFTVVGVMPPEFNGVSVDTAPDVWIPLRAFPSIAGVTTQQIDLGLDGRLRPGFTLPEAQAECRTIFQSTMKDYYLNIAKLPPQTARAMLRRKFAVQSLAHGTSTLRENFGSVLKLLLASAGLLLLVVCSNVGGLLLAHAATRQQEFAVRLALGATRKRLVRQAIAEGAVLAVLGATGGLLIARAAIPLIPRTLPTMRSIDTTIVPLSIHLGFSGRIPLFVLGASFITMVLFSASPAVFISRSRLESVLRSVRASSAIRGRQVLMALQIALCTFLLAIAGLFVRTIWQLDHVKSGMDVDHIETFTGNLARYKNSAAFLKTLTERVRQIPGVISCAVSSMGVMREHGEFTSVAPAGQRMTQAEFLDTATNDVSPGYFETMGMHVLEGRGFLATDVPKPKTKAPVVAVVNEAFVRRFFPNTDPVGKLFGMPASGVTEPQGVAQAQFEIIGVVSDAKDRSLRESIPPMFYTAQTKFSGFVLYIRTPLQPEAIVEPVRKLWQSTGPGVPFLEVDTLAEEVRQTTADERLTAALSSVFGAIAALLAGLGIYGLLAYLVTQRRREIGIRMALGAEAGHIAQLIGGQALIMTAVGAAVGLGSALIAAPAIRSLLYGISPEDPRSLAASILFVTVTVALATLVPVVRAIRTEPAETLREETSG
jgi:predicted permease